MTSSWVFLYFCLFFVGGIFLNSLIKIPQIFMLGFLIFGLILISVLWKYKHFAIIGFCILFFVLGIWRHQSAETGIMNNELVKLNDSGESITLIGIVNKEPDVRVNSIKLTIKSEQLDISDELLAISGKVLVTTNRYPEYKYGDELEITGTLKTPSKDIEGFNYRDYLSKDGIYSEMSWPEIKLVKSNQGNFIYAGILSFKEKLRQVIYQNLSPPQSSILGAVILGDKRQLSEDLKNKLNIAGVRHITAISGMHITIIAGILMALAIGLGLTRGRAFWVAVALLFLYIIMVGAPASAIRAGIMGGLLLLGQKMGRMSISSRAIVFVAALMLLQNPLILKLDIGFQLSFLAVTGIIYLVPHFQKWLSALYNPKIFPLRDLLSMTFAAQIFTLPVLIYNFGYFSLVAPLVNVLIVPLLPYIIISGFIFGFLGIILPAFSWVLSWASWLLLTYITTVIDLFSKMSFSKITAENIHWIWMAVFYLILTIFVWRLRERQKLKFLGD